LANESAERREKIANQTFELQRLKLENVISSGKEEIERRQLAEQELMARVAALEAELAETSQKSSQDLEASKAELVRSKDRKKKKTNGIDLFFCKKADLQSEIANLKSVSAKRESALRGEMDAAEEEHARAMEEARSIHASQVEAAKAEAERINNLRGLQAAMAHRIESLEVGETKNKEKMGFDFSFRV
jgi:hypothetical protein